MNQLSLSLSLIPMAAPLTHPLINDGWFIEKNGQWPGQGRLWHSVVAIATRIWDTQHITRAFSLLRHSHGSQGWRNPSRWKVKVPGCSCFPIFQLWQCLGSWWCYSGYWTWWILVSRVVSYNMQALIDTWIACYSYQEMITHLAMNSHPNPKKVRIYGKKKKEIFWWDDLITLCV